MSEIRIDGYALYDEERRIIFNPEGLFAKLARLYGIAEVGEAMRLAVIAQAFKNIDIQLRPEECGGLLQVFQVRGQLPRVVVLEWYEKVYLQCRKKESVAA